MTDVQGILIRPATLADAGQIHEWESQFPSDRLSRRSVRWLIQSPSARVLVAEAEAGLLGNIVLLARRNARSARLYSLFVAPAARGQRIAERLIEAAESAARQLERTKLSLEVRVDAKSAQALYKRCGYVTTKTLEGYYDDGADGLRLEKSLA